MEQKTVLEWEYDWCRFTEVSEWFLRCVFSVLFIYHSPPPGILGVFVW